MKHIIKRPMISEKNAILNEQGIYVFEVETSATKDDIRKAMKDNFGVKVDSVRTAICRGRAKTNKFGTGRVPHWKKATIKLATGEKIALFEGA
jgi:large subunit ribosomal protein L23